MVRDEAVAVVLAAGKSTRMNSDLPKVLVDVRGRPMIEYVLEAVRAAGIRRLLVVVGHRAEMVREALEGAGDIEFVEQVEQRGTGHAVAVCSDSLAGGNGPVVVLAGDAPLIRPESIKRLLEEQASSGAACVIASAVLPEPFGYGRIVRDDAGNFQRIVEQRDASSEVAAIDEVNSGLYVFQRAALVDSLAQLEPSNAQKELYLTDCAGILQRTGKLVRALPLLDADEIPGVNTPEQLHAVDRLMQQRMGKRLVKG